MEVDDDGEQRQRSGSRRKGEDHRGGRDLVRADVEVDWWIGGDWPMADVEERWWIGCWIGMDPERTVAAADTGWMGQAPRI